MEDGRLVLEERDRDMAMYLTMAIRNEMEDFHHEHLSDEQMAELNPIVRHALLNALHALRYANQYENAKSYVDFTTSMIPSYWEDPTLKPSLTRESGYEERDLAEAQIPPDPRDVRGPSAPRVSELYFNVDEIAGELHDPTVYVTASIRYADGTFDDIEVALSAEESLYWDSREPDMISTIHG